MPDAGVIGLAVARALATAGMSVTVLEKNSGPAEETSGRNSGVIHGGLYYPTGSLKAQLCVRGKNLMYTYAAEKLLPVRRTGKLVVATSRAQHGALEQLLQQAHANGVTDCEWLDGPACVALEPEVAATAGILSPTSGIVDVQSLVAALEGDIIEAGGSIHYDAAVRRVSVCTPSSDSAQQLILHMDSGSGSPSDPASPPATLVARTVINSAGLHAHTVAATIESMPPACIPQVRFAKGNYVRLKGPPPFSRLLYPMPEDGGLGAHMTLDIEGSGMFGPDVEWLEHGDAARVDYEVADARVGMFLENIRKYWPRAEREKLEAGFSGMRTKLNGPGEGVADFLIQGEEVHGTAGLVNLFGMESPGLTSALAIGEYVRDKIMV